MNDPLAYLPFHGDDFYSSSAVARMRARCRPDAEALYTRFLWLEWRSGGPVDDDPEVLRDLLGAGITEWDSAWKLVLGALRTGVVDGVRVLFSPRLELERERAHASVGRRASAAKKAAAARWSKRSQALSDAIALRPHSDRNADRCHGREGKGGDTEVTETCSPPGTDISPAAANVRPSAAADSTRGADANPLPALAARGRELRANATALRRHLRRIGADLAPLNGDAGATARALEEAVLAELRGTRVEKPAALLVSLLAPDGWADRWLADRRGAAEAREAERRTVLEQERSLAAWGRDADPACRPCSGRGWTDSGAPELRGAPAAFQRGGLYVHRCPCTQRGQTTQGDSHARAIPAA